MVLNTIQVLSAVFYPIAPAACRYINRACAAHLGVLTVLAERVLGIDIIMTGDKPAMKQNALVIANHQAMTDILVYSHSHGAVDV